jgi:rubrerythrin
VRGRARGKTRGLLVSDRSSADQYEAAEYVEFLGAGEPAEGEYYCSACGYGVTVQRQLPLCPMCGGAAWEVAARVGADLI